MGAWRGVPLPDLACPLQPSSLHETSLAEAILFANVSQETRRHSNKHLNRTIEGIESKHMMKNGQVKRLQGR